jgi:hypothetical protein
MVVWQVNLFSPCRESVLLQGVRFRLRESSTLDVARIPFISMTLSIDSPISITALSII